MAVGALAFYTLHKSKALQRPNNVYPTPGNMKHIDITTEAMEEKLCNECPTNDIQHATPMDAFKNGKREKLLFTTANRTDNVSQSDEGDFVAVVDVNPSSPTYCSIIAQVPIGKNEEVHHSGWNACSSCYGMSGFNRKYLVVPAFTSGNIHFIDVSDPLQPKLHKVRITIHTSRSKQPLFCHIAHFLDSFWQNDFGKIWFIIPAYCSLFSQWKDYDFISWR